MTSTKKDGGRSASGTTSSAKAKRRKQPSNPEDQPTNMTSTNQDGGSPTSGSSSSKKYKPRKQLSSPKIVFFKEQIKRQYKKAEDERKGLCGTKPCTNIRLFVGVYAFLFLARGALRQYMNNVLEHIQRHTALRHKDLAFVMGVEKMGVVLVLLLAAYYGNRMHKPLAVFVGSLLCVCGAVSCSVPYFRSMGQTYVDEDVPIYYEANLCQVGGTVNVSTTELTQCGALAVSKNVTSGNMDLLCAGGFLTGVGSALMYTLGFIYIEESVKKDTAPLYYGIILSLNGLGEMLGLLAAWQCTATSLDLQEALGLYEWSSGAWWLGFPIIACLTFLLALPLLAFPKWLQEPPWLLKRRRRRIRRLERLLVEEERLLRRAEVRRLRRKRKKKEHERRKRERERRKAEKEQRGGDQNEAHDNPGFEDLDSEADGNHGNGLAGVSNGNHGNGVTNGSATNGHAIGDAATTSVDKTGSDVDDVSDEEEDPDHDDDEEEEENPTNEDADSSEADEGNPGADPDDDVTADAGSDANQTPDPEQVTSRPRVRFMEEDTDKTQRDPDEILQIEDPEDVVRTGDDDSMSGSSKSDKSPGSRRKREYYLGRNLQDLPRNLLFLMTRPVLCLALFGTILGAYSPAGYTATLPHYIHTLYPAHQPPAYLVAGLPYTVAMTVGTLISGCILYKRPLQLLGQVKVILVLQGVASVMMLLMMAVSCDQQSHLWGDGDSFNNITAYSLSEECNIRCDCEGAQLDPVCSQSGVMYPSACHAGCRTAQRSTEYQSLVYDYCACHVDVVLSMAFCEVCSSHKAGYAVLVFLYSLVQSLGYVSLLLVIIRCVSLKLRSIALGYVSWATILIAFVPGVAVYEAFQKVACRFEQPDCLEDDVCWNYNSDTYRYLQHGATAAFQLASFVCFLALFFVLRKRQKAALAVDVEKEKKDKLKTNTKDETSTEVPDRRTSTIV